MNAHRHSRDDLYVEVDEFQRDLSGVNVGANTGRDHFSGWSLDWINQALGYMPYLRRFYAPADARGASTQFRPPGPAASGGSAC